MSIYAVPTYEPFTEYSSLLAASGSNAVDLATSGFYLTNGTVVEQWGGGSSGFGLFFSQGTPSGSSYNDVMVTNNSATVFTSGNLAAILPSGFPGAGGDINITAFVPQNQGANHAGNSAVLQFAQDIPRPTNGVETIYVSYLLDVTGNFSGATGGNSGRYAGFLSQTNLYEGTGSGGAYGTWTAMFNTFNSSITYVSYGEKTNTPAVGGGQGDNIEPSDSSNGGGGPGASGIKAIYNTANFVVGCFAFTAGGATKDTNTVWLNPPVGDFGGPVPSTNNITSFTMGTVMNDVDAFFLESRSGGATGGIGPTFIGNLLIGTTWSYVTGGPEFTNSPADVQITAYGTNVTLSGGAVAAAQNVTYHWQKVTGGTTNNLADGTGTAGGTASVSGAHSSTLTLSNVSAGDTGQYQLVATASGTGFSLTSSQAVLSSSTADPVITSQPAPAAANYGSTVQFLAGASSSQASMSYQWYLGTTPLTNGVQPDGSSVSGAVGAVASNSLATTLTLSNVSYQESGGYWVWVTNNVNRAASSSSATLNVNDPVIVTQPGGDPILLMNGGSGTISLVAAGTGVTYQWYGSKLGLLNNGGNFAGVTTSTLTITNAQAADSDAYYCVVGGASGQTVASSGTPVSVENPAGTAINIMPFGGSIVAGQSAQSPYQGGGFRTGLYLDLVEDGRFSPNLVGSSTALLANNPTNVNPLTTANQLHHEGHPGYTTIMTLINVDASDGSSGSDGGYWLAPGNGVNPSCILVNIGGNDALKYGTDAATMASAEQRLDATVSAFNTLRPGVNTIVSTICYRGDDSGAYSAGLDAYFNPAIGNSVFNHVLAGQSVGYLDLRSVMNYPTDFGTDHIHPIQSGYDKMAAAWYQCLLYGAAYWTGSQDNLWNTVNGGASNWAIDSARKLDRQKGLNDPTTTAYDIYPDVFFNSNAGALSTLLGTNTTIRSLNFTKGASGPVTVGGSNTLTIGSLDFSVTLSTPYYLMNSGGITVQAGSGAHTLAANVMLGVNQTWGNVSSNAFTVTGSISGANSLTIVGAYRLYNPGVYTPSNNTVYATYTTVKTDYVGNGTIVLAGNNTYRGGTTVSSGTLVVTGQSGTNSGTGTGAVSVLAGGILSGNGCIAGSVTVANSSNALLYPNINGGGSLTLASSLTFSGSSAGVRFNLSSNSAADNDEVVLENGTLACGGAQITIRSAGGLSTSDYALFNAGPSGTISGSFNPIPLWSGTPPQGASQYRVQTFGNTVVLHYLPPPPAEISLSSSNLVTLRFFGLPTNTYVVQMTTNLAGPWRTVSTNEAGVDGAWTFQDSSVLKNPQGFYRVVAPPPPGQ